MRTSHTVIFILVSALLLNCSEQETEHQKDSEVSTFDDVLKDNNGKPWKVQHSTDSLIDQMVNRIDNFVKSDTLLNYSKLKANLNQDFVEIFDRCTMTGEGHNQLHNYLIPLRNKIKIINDTVDDENEDALNEIQSYLKEFNKYFEL